MEGIGAGIAALAFWGFVAAVAIAGILDNAKKRQSQHETLRRLIESGKAVDQDLVDRLLADDQGKRPYKGLRIAGIIVLSLAPGLAILGALLGQIDRRAELPLMGSAALMACLGVGLLVAAALDRRDQLNEIASTGKSQKI